MNSICQKLILLMLMMSAALMSAPGLGRSIAKAQHQDTEAPTESVETFELVEAGVARQNRRIRIEGLCQPESVRLYRCKFVGSLRFKRTGSLFKSTASSGHRLPNGLLAPLRI